MLKKSIWVILLLLLNFPIEADPGFLIPSTEAKISKASIRSTFRYVALVDTPYIYQAHQYDLVVKAMWNTNFRNRLIAKRILDCKARELPECEFYYGGTGTAFLVGKNQDTLVTVSHNLKSDISSFMSGERIKQLGIWFGDDESFYHRNMPLNFQLYNYKNELVFDTRLTGDYAAVEVLGNGKMVDYKKTIVGEMAVDFVKIKLSRAVAEFSLEWSDSSFGTGKKLSTIGFPRNTGTRFMDDANESDGFKQFVNFGSVVALKSASDFNFTPDFIISKSDQKKLNQYFYYSNHECVHGMSGSPVLDEHGKVAAVLTGCWAGGSSRFYNKDSAILLKSDWIQQNFDKYKI